MAATGDFGIDFITFVSRYQPADIREFHTEARLDVREVELNPLAADVKTRPPATT
jgi:hypothetical protein